MTFENPPLPNPRSRMTIRRIMAAVVVAACYAGEYAYFERWEARRSVMYHQRDMTRSIIEAAYANMVPAIRPGWGFRNPSDSETHPRYWTERICTWKQQNGRLTSQTHATISGANGWLSLQPITIEIDGSPSNDAWLDPLLRAYREKGWRYRVITLPESYNTGSPKDPRKSTR
jgi:hypothetical protein